MKKTVFFLFLLFIVVTYEQIEFIDMNDYKIQQKTVEIKGEVQKPGVYTLNIHDTLETAIKKSGGITNEADLSSINLTSDIENNSVIIVPKKTEQMLISINSASLEELDMLPGIGPGIAQRIIEYREKSQFQKLEDLMEVKGIGEKMFLKIKDKLSL